MKILSESYSKKGNSHDKYAIYNFFYIMMNIVGTVVAAADENKLTAECMSDDLFKAWDAKDFDTALKMFFYIELCVEADWDRLSLEQIRKWGEAREWIMGKTFQLYTGSERFTKVFTDDKGKKVQYASDLLTRLQNDQYAVDASWFLDGKSLMSDDQLKKDRIAALQRIGIVQPMP